MTTNETINPLDQHLDAILRASGSALRHHFTPGQTSGTKTIDAMRAALLAAVAQLAPASGAPANHFPDAAKMVAGDVAMPVQGIFEYVAEDSRWMELEDNAPETEKSVGLVLHSDALAALAAKDAEVARLSDEDEINTATISRMSRLLAEVAIAVKGDEQPLKRHGWADIAELVQKGMLELELYRANAPELQKQIDSSTQLIKNLESRNAGLATDLAAARQHMPAHAPTFSAIAARKLVELRAKGFVANGVSIEKTEATGQVTRGFITHGGLVGWWSLGAGVQSGPVLLTDDVLVEINLHVAMNEVADSDGSREIVIKHGRRIEAAVHAANPVPVAQDHKEVMDALKGIIDADDDQVLTGEHIERGRDAWAKAAGQEGGAS